jgi:predicted ATPase/DNA-binding SARP family transcriptional activator
VRYLILGTTEARSDHGAPLPLGGPRVRALLTVLALRPGHPVPVATLIDSVWATDPPQDAPSALQALVSRLRRALGRDAVSSGPGGYRLHAAPGDVDLHRFERLTADAGHALDSGDPATAARLLDDALALWRGPALADLPDRSCAAARPEALRTTALHRRAEAALALGRHAEVLPHLRELTAEHPLHEPLRALLIRALAACGRRADALAAYEDARRTLADRLGTDPGPELRALHAQLLAAPEPAPAPDPAPPEAPRRGNLRARLTSFVGREEELRSIRRDLATARLVTLTGPGGSGKTRLSEEVAATLQQAVGSAAQSNSTASNPERSSTRNSERSSESSAHPPTGPERSSSPGPAYPDGVWLAELAPVEHPSAVPGAVLSALGGRLTTVYGRARDGLTAEPADPVARLLEHCAGRRLLLVLDNCEHLIAACAELAETLLAACPGVTVLATSREPLGIPGEAVRPVEPLPPPTAERLFTDRAAAVRPGFDPAADPAAVAEICRRLDGLPLAIELAAARLRMLTPRQIADRLDDRFRLLTVGARTALPRQQTLRAVVDWSWDLLTEPERTMLRRLSVFAGGCTLAGAEAVCAGDGIDRADVLDLLGALVDKSLLVAEEPRDLPGDGFRYRMLETIHEYSAERAAHAPGHAATARRHTAHYRQLVTTAALRLRAAGQLTWFARLEIEHDNVRAALRRCVEAGDEETALTVAIEMTWFWVLRNYRDEAVAWLREAIDLGPRELVPGDPLYWPRVEARLCYLLNISEYMTESQRHEPEVLALARQVVDAYGEGGPQTARMPGVVWAFAGFLHFGQEEGMRMADITVASCRAHGGRWELAMALLFRALVSNDYFGGLERGERDVDEAMAIIGDIGDRWARAQLLGARAEIDTVHGDHAAARAHYAEAVRLTEELGAHQERPFLTARLADLAHRAGEYAEAERLLCAADEDAARHGAQDARALVRYMRGAVCARRGRWAEAAGHLAAAREAGRSGTPPPMFHSAVAALAARIHLAGGDGPAALREALAGLRAALDGKCDERLVAAMLEIAALTVAETGAPDDAARLLGTATALRGGLPRSVPEQDDTDAVLARAGAALPAQELADALADGARLGGEEAALLLAGMGTLSGT